MESPESPPFMSFLVQDIPLACVLSQRLGPKPVSDPFLNHDGHLISHDAIFRLVHIQLIYHFTEEKHLSSTI